MLYEDIFKRKYYSYIIFTGLGPVPNQKENS
jgi:hypothetical protein